MDLNRALEEAINGDAILFTGAGFSKGASNIEDNDLPTGVELAKYFCSKCGIKEPLDLDEASDFFLEKFGEDALIEDLKTKYTVKTISTSHLDICSVNWKRIYTTNYDNVIEQAHAQISKKVNPVIIDDDLRATNLNTKLCIHINGYIDRLDRGSIKEGFKLTNTSYLTDIFTSSEWFKLFKTDLSISRSVFFVGYSLYDLDIKRILYQLESLKNKCFFITSKDPSEALTIRLKKFGHVIAGGTDAFSQSIKSTMAKYTPVELDETAYTSFERMQNPVNVSEKLRDDHVFNLLLYGRSDLNFVWQSLQDPNFPPYYLHRSELDKVFSSIQSGVRNILLHSDLGNGKTMLVEGLKATAMSSHMEVFHYRERNARTLIELDHISKYSSPVLLILENYHNELSLIEQIQLKRPPDLTLVLTCRSTTNDVFFDRLDNVLSHKDILEFDLNCLSESEVLNLITLLEHYGLWGAHSAKDLSRKKNYICYDCKAEFQGVLIDLIKSPEIQNRFIDIFKTLNERMDFYQVIILSFILEIIGFTPRIDMIMDLLNTNVINSAVFRKNETVRQMVNFRSDEILIKSSVLAKYVLTNISDGNLVVDTLIDVARNSEALMRHREVYNNIFRNVMLYSVVQTMVPERNKRPNIIRFYESIKNLNHTATNPFFWLQYAIARLFFKEYDKAKIYFDTAYSYAKKRHHFNTYQIDNHFARYLLEKSIAVNDQGTCMASFRDAHQIISRQIRDERKHYPYRVARNYFDFYRLYFSSLRSVDQEYIIRSCKYVLEHIEKLPPMRRDNTYVIQCEDRMREILDAH